MKIWIVEGHEQYEPSWVMGVYATEEIAERVSEHYTKQEDSSFVYYGVSEYEVETDWI